MTFELLYDPNYNKQKQNKSGAKAAGDWQYPFGQIIQYAIAVQDIDKVCEFYKKLGFPVRGIDRDNAGASAAAYRGEREDFLMHMGWSKAGSVTLEIIQPTRDGTSTTSS